MGIKGLFDRKPIDETIVGKNAKRIGIEMSQNKHGVTGMMIAKHIAEGSKVGVENALKINRFNIGDERDFLKGD